MHEDGTRDGEKKKQVKASKAAATSDLIYTYIHADGTQECEKKQVKASKAAAISDLIYTYTHADGTQDGEKKKHVKASKAATTSDLSLRVVAKDDFVKMQVNCMRIHT